MRSCPFVELTAQVNSAVRWKPRRQCSVSNCGTGFWNDILLSITRLPSQSQKSRHHIYTWINEPGFDLLKPAIPQENAWFRFISERLPKLALANRFTKTVTETMTGSVGGLWHVIDTSTENNCVGRINRLKTACKHTFARGASNWLRQVVQLGRHGEHCDMTISPGHYLPRHF